MSESRTDFDLNLLRHLKALLDARSVSGAAENLGLSQPSLSRSLATLRTTFGDPLLVRSGRSMIPTPRALELRAELEPLLRNVGVLVQPAEFDPSTAQRRFALGMSDLIAPLLLPRIVPALARDAPGIELSVRATPTPTEDLLSGRLDAMAGSALDHSEFHRTSLRIHTGTWHVLLGPLHPSYGGVLTKEAWLASGHVQIAPAGRYGRPGHIDGVVAAAGLTRKTVLELGHIAALADVLIAAPLGLQSSHGHRRESCAGQRPGSGRAPLRRRAGRPRACPHLAPTPPRRPGTSMASRVADARSIRGVNPCIRPADVAAIHASRFVP